MLGDTGNKRAIRILLECILVLIMIDVIMKRVLHSIMITMATKQIGLMATDSGVVHIMTTTAAMWTSSLVGTGHIFQLLFPSQLGVEPIS